VATLKKQTLLWSSIYRRQGEADKRGGIISRLFAILIFLLGAAALRADAAPGDTAWSAAGIVAAARAEKTLVLYTSLHADETIKDIRATFEKRYPFLTIKEADGDSTVTYERFRRDVVEGRPSADFVWSSAMDMQQKLINDGYAQPYRSSQKPFLPSWTNWRNLGYGVAVEPVAFVYNSRFISRRDMPNTHAGLRKFLLTEGDKFKGRIATYDPKDSQVGVLLLTQDIRITRDAWDLFDTFGALDAHGYLTSRDMMEHVVNGDQWLAYDVIASYAVELQKTHPELVVVYPADYSLILSRVAFIAAGAKHPNAAKLFLDFLLSREGQQLFLKHGMGSIRTDMGTQMDPSQPGRNQIIRIGPALLSDMDNLVRAQFFRRWNRARGEHPQG
jgi:iron(III) transport system substrate-binding protein